MVYVLISLMGSLEDRLIEDLEKGEEVELERALLIISGFETEEQIKGYKQKLDWLQEGFQRYLVKKEKRTFKF